MRLLLIEDDEDTAAAIVDALTTCNHVVDVATEGTNGLRRAIGGDYDVVIADRMLPGMDGLAVVTTMRAQGLMVPTLLLTAMGSVGDRVAGLQGGADDYLVKPFSMAELEARVTALGRRVNATTPTLLVLADLQLDRLAREVRRGDNVIDLQPREFQLLELLMLSSPAVVTRMMLLERVWRFHFDPGTNLVESHVSRLRTKIDRGGDAPLIITIRGEGYAARAGLVS